MNRRRIAVIVTGTLLIGAAVVLVPGTPISLYGHLWPEQVLEGRPRGEWLARLDSADPDERAEAVEVLAVWGDDQAAQGLAGMLGENRPAKDRLMAVRALATLARTNPGALTPAVIGELGQSLGDHDLPVRYYAAEALFRLKARAHAAVPALIDALADTANRAAPLDSTITVQQRIVEALGRAGTGRPETVPALVRALRAAPNENLALVIVQVLKDMGAEARPAAAELRSLLKGTGIPLRRAAAAALHAIDGAGNSASETVVDVELPVAQREYLWAIEHHGNVLSQQGFGPLAAALKAADRTRLAGLLADDFKGSDLGNPQRTRINGFAHVERLQEGDAAGVPLDGPAFVARLLALRAFFTQAPPQVKLAVMTLSPKIREDLNGAWAGMAQLRMHGEATPGAPAEVVAVLHFELAQLNDKHLRRPGWLRAASIVQVHTATAPRYLFAEVGAQRGLDAAKLHDNWTATDTEITPGGVYVTDFDRDGILDLLVTDTNGNTLYRGRPGGRFEDVTAAMGLDDVAPGARAAAWVDIDGDGWDDLIMGGQIFRNDAGKRFIDYTARCNLRLPKDATNLVIADYDCDGKLDLYVPRRGRPGGNSWLDHRSDDVHVNYLFRNLGNWQFADVTAASGTGGDYRSTFSAAWLDANNDGWPDLHVINEFGDGVLLVNRGDGTFAPHRLADRPADFGSMGLAVGDVNNDGNIDIYCANMYSKAGTRIIGNLAPDAYPPETLERMRRFVAGSQLHLNRGGLKFEQVGQKRQVAAVGWAYGACLADLDNDGWLDLYATAGFVSRSRDEPDG